MAIRRGKAAPRVARNASTAIRSMIAVRPFCTARASPDAKNSSRIRCHASTDCSFSRLFGAVSDLVFISFLRLSVSRKGRREGRETVYGVNPKNLYRGRARPYEVNPNYLLAK